MNQSFDQQLLPFLLKKYPEKFKVIGSSVMFLEVYKKDVAKARQAIVGTASTAARLRDVKACAAASSLEEGARQAAA